MPPAEACPSAAALQRWLHGAILPSEAEPLERHVEQCPACQRSLGALDVADGLLHTAARSLPTPPSSPVPTSTG